MACLPTIRPANQRPSKFGKLGASQMDLGFRVLFASPLANQRVWCNRRQEAVKDDESTINAAGRLVRAFPFRRRRAMKPDMGI